MGWLGIFLDSNYLNMINIAERFFIDLVIHHNVPGNGCNVAEAVVVHLNVVVALQVLPVSISKHRKSEVL